MTIGSMEDLDRASLDDIRDFYNTYYVPNNVTLVVVGDFDKSQAQALVEEYFGALAPGAQPLGREARKIPAEPPQTAKRVVKVTQNAALPAFVEGYHMPADGLADAYPPPPPAHIPPPPEPSRTHPPLAHATHPALHPPSPAHP